MGGLLLCMLPVGGGAAFGVELPRPDEATDFLAPARIADAHPRWASEHEREAALLGGFLFWPAVSIGPVYDSNVFEEHRGGPDAVGLGLAPALLAERSSGPHRTDLYGTGDIRLFPERREADITNGRFGALHDWSIRPDLAVRMQAEVARRTDPFDGTRLLAERGPRGLVFETDKLAAASLQKTLGRLFVALSGTALRADFDAGGRLRDAVGARSLSGETVTTLKTRVGYLLPSSVFVFAEPGVDWRDLDRVRGTATGVRTVAGVGVARFGLLSGEVFGGWQEQAYPRQATLSEPVIGGRLAWSPDRAWDLATQFDRTLGDVAVGTLADPLGTATRTDTALLSLTCTVSPQWRAQAEAGAIWVDYVGTRRSDTVLGSKLRSLPERVRVVRSLS